MAAGDVASNARSRESPRQLGFKLRVCNDDQFGAMMSTESNKRFNIAVRNEHAGSKAIRLMAYNIESHFPD
jgi:hypothetical protein